MLSPLLNLALAFARARARLHPSHLDPAFVGARTGKGSFLKLDQFVNSSSTKGYAWLLFLRNQHPTILNTTLVITQPLEGLAVDFVFVDQNAS